MTSSSTSLNHSNSVFLDNVDDYLAPSQACINPLFSPSAAEKKEGEPPDENKPTAAAVVVPRRRRRRKIPVVENGDVIKPPIAEQQEDNKKEAVKASMADCLACSGCVTTAETVLIEQQHSLTSLRERLQQQQNANRIITVSPNSWADLCRHWKLSDDINNHDCYRKFTTLLSRILSAQVVVDGNVPLQWSWIDEAEEFCKLYSQKKQGTTSSSTPFPSVAIDSTKTQVYCPDGTSKILDTAKASDDEATTAPILPLISGSCPALVCLVEKTLTNLVPHLSQTVSPMSMVGMVLKEQQQNSIHWDHWAIMPCHDKKLEASRKDFYLSDRKEQCVDLVISTKECVELVEEWIAKENGSGDAVVNVANFLESLPPSDLTAAVLQPEDLVQKAASYSTNSNNSLLIAAPLLQQAEGTGTEDVILKKQMAFASGGHANYIFKYAANKLFGCNPEHLNVEWKAASMAASKNVKSARLARQRKQHFYEVKLYRQQDGSYVCNRDDDDETSTTAVLHFAIAHGMQTIQRALKIVANDNPGIQYLEAMACPHGCVNGGGSARSQSTSGSTNSSVVIRETPTETQARVQKTLAELQVPSPSSEPSTTDCGPHKTRYHVVPPMQYTMGATAGVQVDKIQW